MADLILAPKQVAWADQQIARQIQVDIAASLGNKTTPGGLTVDDIFQREISDILRRQSAFQQRVKNVLATGQPSRYIEKEALPGGQGFVATNNLVPPGLGTPNRDDKSVYLKALMGGMDMTLFEVEINTQQGVFTQVQAQDFNDTVDGLLNTHGKALWRGTSTGPTDSGGLQYAGYFNQLVDGGNLFTTSVLAGASIVDAINLKVAQIVAQEDVDVGMNNIVAYAHPLAGEFINREVKGNTTHQNTIEIIPGVRVPAIATMAGNVPIVPDPFMGKVQIAAPNDAYPIALVNEPLVEYHYLTTAEPRVFELGLASGLARRRVILKFGAMVVKHPDVAHALVKVADNWTPPV